jgi:hypothetical protein
MYVTEQKVIAQTLGNRIERVRNKVNVVQRAYGDFASSAETVKFDS